MGAPNFPSDPTAAQPVYVGTVSFATNGIGLPLSSLARTMTYDVSNRLLTISVTYQGVVYTQTYTYTGSNPNPTTIGPFVPAASGAGRLYITRRIGGNAVYA